MNGRPARFSVQRSPEEPRRSLVRVRSASSSREGSPWNRRRAASSVVTDDHAHLPDLSGVRAVPGVEAGRRRRKVPLQAGAPGPHLRDDVRGPLLEPEGKTDGERHLLAWRVLDSECFHVGRLMGFKCFHCAWKNITQNVIHFVKILHFFTIHKFETKTLQQHKPTPKFT